MASFARVPRIAVERFGLPASWLGYRWVEKETVPQYVERTAHRNSRYRTIHAEETYPNPLPRNVDSREMLPKDAGWWKFSFWDVPARRAGETFIATVPDCRVVHYVEDDAEHPFVGDFYVALFTRDDRSLELREIRCHPRHREILRESGRVERVARATWILERVYHNYSHWFTAHVPKLLLLQAEGLLEDLVLPRESNRFIDGSLALLGLNRRDFRSLHPETILRAAEMTLIGSDRFRPELLRSVQNSFHQGSFRPGRRRIFISRANAPRRRLVNENEIWPILERNGFERVVMEDLAFEQQVALMSDTAILFALHGAGLTNMLFCAPGTHVVEIADLSFPNPNFYAMAGALNHYYWLLAGVPIGTGHPLTRDVAIDPQLVRDLLPELLAEVAGR